MQAPVPKLSAKPTTTEKEAESQWTQVKSAPARKYPGRQQLPPDGIVQALAITFLFRGSFVRSVQRFVDKSFQ